MGLKVVYYFHKKKDKPTPKNNFNLPVYKPIFPFFPFCGIVNVKVGAKFKIFTKYNEL